MYEILVLAKRLGFEYFSYIQRVENIEEDVLFGAYGKPGEKITIREPRTA